MKVAFINENTLGHASYLVPYVDWFRAHPECGVQPFLLNATPLPKELAARADYTVPGLRKAGLDFHVARWRFTVSRHVREQLEVLRKQHKIEAAVVNTQSVALRLAETAKELPVFVCLDATFEQLAQSRWFAPNLVSRSFLPLTIRGLKRSEQLLFSSASRLLPWSEPARASLLKAYSVAAEKIAVLPPSLTSIPAGEERKKFSDRPRLLFVGGDFQRKGGPLLLECFRRHLRSKCDLHIVTQSDVAEESGVFVHRGLAAHGKAWREQWETADLFVFPSTLETFGIVLLEALSFGVPVISSEAGAARDILNEGKCGCLLPALTPDILTSAIEEALKNPVVTQQKAVAGKARVEEHYNLNRNAAKLAEWLSEAIR